MKYALQHCKLSKKKKKSIDPSLYIHGFFLYFAFYIYLDYSLLPSLLDSPENLALIFLALPAAALSFSASTASATCS